MKQTNTVRSVVAVSLGVLISVQPAVAQSGASVNKQLISNLNHKLLYMAIPVALAVELLLFYTVFKYRNNDNPAPTEDNRRLEITWTAATAMVLVFVGIAATVVLMNPYISPALATSGGQQVAATGQQSAQPGAQNAHQQRAKSASNASVNIDVLAYQWGWKFSYRGTNVTTNGTVVVPTNKTVHFYMSSQDVLHSFYVPKLGLKKDVFPGRTTNIRTRVTKPGSYTLYCAEFCGPGHSRMRGHVVAKSPSQYQKWLKQHESQSGNTTAA